MVRWSLIFVCCLATLYCDSPSPALGCITYQAGDQALPNPFAARGGTFRASEVWGDAFVMADDQGIMVVDFSEPESPRVLGQAATDCRVLAVDGDLLAVGRTGGADLFRLPGLTPLASLELGEAVYGVALDDGRLAAAGDHQLYLFDVTDPTAPLQTAQLYVEGTWAIGNIDRLLYSGPRILLHSYGGSNIGGRFTYLFVIDVADPAAPAVTDFVNSFPNLYEDQYCWFDQVAPVGPGFVVHGVKWWTNPSEGDGIICRYQIDEEGHGQWVGALIGVGSMWGYLAVEGESALVVSYYDQAETSYLVDLSWSNTSDRPGVAAHVLPVGPLAWLPQRGVLAAGAETWLLGTWRLNSEEDIWSLSTNSTLVPVDERMMAELRWSVPINPGEAASWFLNVFDMGGEDPVRAGGIGADWTTVESVYPLGRRLYLPLDGFRYVEVAADGQVGPLCASSLSPFRGVLPWGDYHLVSHADGRLVVHSLAADGEPVEQAAVALDRAGSLLKVGDHVYVQPSGTSSPSLVDLADPLNPQAVGTLSMTGKLRCFEPNLLFRIEGSRLSWYFVGDPQQPALRGSWDAGATITDCVLSGENLYLSLGGSGVQVHTFYPSSGPRLVGNNAGFRNTGLQLFGYGIVANASGPRWLPLLCGDPLPLVVSGFTAAAQAAAVVVQWESRTASDAGSTFRLDREQAGTATVLDRWPTGLGNYRLEDRPAPQGGDPRYRLVLCRGDGAELELAALTVQMGSLATFGPTVSASPNPANPWTTVSYTLPRGGQMRLGVYTLAGRHVIDLVDEELPAGGGSVIWDGRDGGGRAVSSGTYLLRLVTAQSFASGRVTLLR